MSAIVKEGGSQAFSNSVTSKLFDMLCYRRASSERFGVLFHKVVLHLPMFSHLFSYTVYDPILGEELGTFRHQPFGRQYGVGHMGDKSVDQMGRSN